jgi:iron-sulfur cluster assembly protein
MTEHATTSILTMSERALLEARALLAREADVRGLRIGVRGGGCSGLSYFAEPAREERPGDRILAFDGLDIFLDVKSQLFLTGTRVEWSDSLLQSGFVFHNPNAKRSCSCGESFTV